MKHIKYAYKLLIREKGKSFIKIISLSLGILVGLQLFARVAFDLNYDNFYRDAENLFIIRSDYTMNGVKEAEMDRYIFAPIPAAIKENFPDEVESATVIREFGDDVFYYGEHRFSGIRMLYGDEFLFQTLGLDVLEGNEEDLANVDMVFISESFARKLSSTGDVIGKMLYIYKSYPVIIKGVFKDIPENTEFNFDLVCSYPTLNKRGDGRRGGWGYDVSYTGFVRFNTPADAEKVEARLPGMLKKYMPNYDVETMRFFFQPISKYHTGKGIVREMILIISILGIAILIVAVMNYVLLSVSSLPSRAKKVGIHKCNGATSTDIMKMFFTETLLLILVSAFIAVFVILNLRGIIESKMGMPLSALLAPENLWLPVALILLILLVGAFIPARLFSKISVNQIFRKYKEKNSFWKRLLLFIQFAGMTFIMSMVLIVLMQYRAVIDKDLGYNPGNLVTSYHYYDNPEQAKELIRRIPVVEDVSMTSHHILDGFSGETIGYGNASLFSTRIMWADYNLIPLMNIKVKEGRNISNPGEVLINEEFVKRMPWTDSPIGHTVSHRSIIYGTVVGVIEDFPVRSLYSPLEPVLIVAQNNASGTTTIKLKEPLDKNLAELNRQIAELFPTEDIYFTSLEADIAEQYISTRNFRDTVIMIFFSIFFMTIVGLIGYTDDEVRRRSKEIAIRKVNGAGIKDVLSLLVENIGWVAIPAVITGTVIAYFVGGQWLTQFQGYRITLHVPFFILIAIAILLIIAGVVIAQTWKVAKANPVESIQSE